MNTWQDWWPCGFLCRVAAWAAIRARLGKLALHKI